jgi:hypothetical protein
MASFKPYGSYSQSLDGKTITFTDTSPYGNNNEGLIMSDFSQRQIVVLDGMGAPVITVTIPDGQTTVSFQITKDNYLASALNWTANSNVFHGELNYLARRFYDLASLSDSNRLDCGCDCLSDINVIKAMACSLVAKTAFICGFADKSQLNIEAANRFLK